jgi:Nif-specific regulatory protein
MNTYYHFNRNALETLYHIARLLGSDKPLDEVMANVLELLETRAGMNRGAVAILKPSGKELAIDISRGLSKDEQRKGRYVKGEGITGKVLESGRPIAVPRVSEEPSFLDRTGARSNISKDDLAFLCVPVTSGDKMVGTLSVDRIVHNRNDTLDDELRFLEAVSDLIARLVMARREQKQNLEALRRENEDLKRTLSHLENQGRSSHIIGNSGSMRQCYRNIAQVAPLETTVLVRGETGTGKELVAHAIHQKSKRNEGPFVAVNCAALPESLLESELFGHEKGSFTGATAKRKGRFESAHGGTLFLDEIAEMSITAQSRLLRVIQEKEITPVGASGSKKVDVRLICATNRNLEDDITHGTFREDLYYRINVVSLFIPPLRERGADILLLADHFINKYASLHDKHIRRLSTPAIDALSAYHWPGNVRELENVIERAVVLSTTDVIDAHDLPPSLQMKPQNSGDTRSTHAGLSEMVGLYEKELITDALKDCRGNQTAAAKKLKTTKRVLQYKVQKHGIDYLRFRTRATETE